MEITIDSMQESYAGIVVLVRSTGRRRAPRGLLTYEVPGAQIILTDPTKALPVNIGRSLSMKIAAIEALQLIGGFCDPAAMLRASPAMSKYMDGGNFWGGYGTRTRGQVPLVIDRLVTDPDTRQAQIVLWDPTHDLLVPDAHDYPCTVSIQFFIVDDALECHVHMRSNDVWKGLSLDVFVFTQMQLAIAAVLGISAGRYFHHAASLHLYETDVEACERLHPFDGDERFSLGSLFVNENSLTGRASADWLAYTKYLREEFRPNLGHDKLPAFMDGSVASWYDRNLS